MTIYENPINEFSDLRGKTLKSVERLGDDELVFETTNGIRCKLYHRQSCCEDVSIEDICGDLDDLVGEPLLVAEEVEGDSTSDEYGSHTWTFYKLDTRKGGVTIRWYGQSNGYYSESVDFEVI